MAVGIANVVNNFSMRIRSELRAVTSSKSAGNAAAISDAFTILLRTISTGLKEQA
jgi:hypothetical protein